MADDVPTPVAEVVADPTGISQAVHALIAAVEEVDEAEHRLEQRVRTVFGVNNTDLAVLRFIDRLQRRGRSARVGDLSKRFGVSSGSATEIVHRLSQAGFVERATDPHDARVRTLVLTARASQRMEEIIGIVRADLDDLLLEISEDEEARMLELLGRVRDIFRSGLS